MSIVDVNNFPYAQNDNTDPYSDGLLASGDNPTIFVPPPGSNSKTYESRSQSGEMVKEYIGDTSMIFADRVWHPVLAGDF